MSDFYEILGVSVRASSEEIKRAYRERAGRLHPDKNSGQDAEERFRRVVEAYKTLSDPDARRRYDRTLRASPPRWSTFGTAAKPVRGSDLRYELRLNFEQAVLGCSQEIEVPARSPCQTCGGTKAEPGTTPTRCPRCDGQGETKSGLLGLKSSCGDCGGTGRVIHHACHSCRGNGWLETSKRIRVQVLISLGHAVRAAIVLHDDLREMAFATLANTLTEDPLHQPSAHEWLLLAHDVDATRVREVFDSVRLLAEKDPDDRNRAALGLAYYDLGKKRYGKEVLERALRLSPRPGALRGFADRAGVKPPKQGR